MKALFAIAAAALALTSCSAPAPVGLPTASVAQTVTPLPTTSPPRVVSTTATESALTITYDRPMRHGLACGEHGFKAGPSNTIDAFETNVSSRYYTSTNPDLDDVLGAMWVASLNADCSAVTFTFVHGVAPGTYPLSITKVQDLAGHPLAQDPTIVTVTFAETAPPRFNLVQHINDTVIVNFSEPITPSLAIDPTRYRLNDNTLPAGSSISCVVRSCAEVVVKLGVARPNLRTLRVIGLTDLAGNSFAPGTDTTDVSGGEGQAP